MLRRILFIFTVPAVLLASIMFATAAQAQSPHFIGTPTCTKSVTSGLTCSGKAAGLGNSPSAAFLTASSVTATYVCQNKGGNVAPGQPVVTQNVTGPTQTITPHNGQITFSPTIPPPATPRNVPTRGWLQCTMVSISNDLLHQISNQFENEVFVKDNRTCY
jgi:hypothetical protein